MEPLNEALRLLRRQAELEETMQRPGGIGVATECELHEIGLNLARYPAAVSALLEAAHRLKRPVDVISITDVEMR
jgi:hypothetical protein